MNIFQIIPLFVFWVAIAGTRGHEPIGVALDMDTPTAKELLDRYADTLDKYQSYIIRSTSLVKTNNSYSGKSPYYPEYISGKYVTYYTYESRYDGKRLKNIRNRWGDLYQDKMNVPETHRHYMSSLWDGINDYQYAHNENEPKHKNLRFTQGKIQGGMKIDYIYRTNLSRGNNYGTLIGYFYGDDDRVDKVLKIAEKISIRDKTENIGGFDCYIIDAITERGRYTLWLDPNHGYNIAKAFIQRNEGDRYYEINVEKKCKIEFMVEIVSFKKTGDVWVPMEADTRLNTNFSYGDFGEKQTHIKITDVIFNPDHDALGSFLTDDIRNGTPVRIPGLDGISYTWQDGKVVDKAGKVVMSCYDPNEVAAGASDIRRRTGPKVESEVKR